MDTGVCHFLAPQELPHRCACSPEGYRFRRDTEFGQLFQNHLFRTASVHPFHRSQVDILSDSLPVAFIQASGQIDLAHHGRQYVTVLQMEVVIRSVQIGRHDGDIIGAVLQVETFTHFQSRNLCDGIRFVGIFQRGGEESLFLHRLGSFPRIDAGAAQKQELLHSMPKAFANDVLLNLQIFVDEVGTVLQVCHDASHMGRGQYHGIRPFFVKETLNGYSIQQIQFLMRASHQVFVSSFLQIVPNGRTYQPPVSGHIYFSCFIQHKLTLYPVLLSSAVSSQNACHAPP